MAEIYKSKITTFSTEEGNYIKNRRNLLDEEKNPIGEMDFKHMIKMKFLIS